MECSMQVNNNTLEISMSGRCTFSDYEHFQDIGDMASENNIKKINIDVGNLEFVDSSGLGMMLMLKEQGDADISLISPAGQVKKVIYVAKMDEVFDVIEN